MALSEFEIKRIEVIVDAFVEKRRPAKEIRDQLDYSFKISDQSFEIFEMRPIWDNPSKKIKNSIVKITYVKKTKLWKLYWKRADLKWHSYSPFPESGSLEEILDIVDQDHNGCFWG